MKGTRRKRTYGRSIDRAIPPRVSVHRVKAYTPLHPAHLRRTATSYEFRRRIDLRADPNTCTPVHPVSVSRATPTADFI